MSTISNVSAPLSRPLVFLLLICGLTAVAAIFWSSQPYGLGLTSDSLNYIAAARNLVAGHGVAGCNGSPLLAAPPLYPATLAVVSILSGIDAPTTARFLNAVLLCGIIWISGILIIRVSRPPVVAALGILAIFFSVPLHLVSRMALSEPLFILVSLLAIVFLSCYLRHPRFLFLFLFMAAVAAACLTRYIGIIFTAAGCLCILIFGRGDIQRRLRDAVFSLMGVIPLALWLIRNHSVSGTLFGPRYPSQYSFLHNVFVTAKSVLSWYLKGLFTVDGSIDANTTYTVNGILTWYLKGSSPYGVFLLAIFTVCVICLFVVWLAAAVRLPELFSSLTRGKGTSMVKGIPPEISVSCLFAAAYLAFLVITSTTTAYDEIGSRLLSPIFVPMHVILFFLLSWESNPTGTTRRIRLWRLLLLVALAVCLIGPIRWTLAIHLQMRDRGEGWSGKTWRKSETISTLSRQAIGDGTVVFTNAPEAFYLYLNDLYLKGARITPGKTMYASKQKIQTLDELRGNWPADNKAILVWFDWVGYEQPYLFTVDELRLIANVREISRLADGTIYLVSKKSPSGASE